MGTPAAEAGPVELRVEIGDPSHMTPLFGQHDEHLKIVEAGTGARLSVSGSGIDVRGDEVSAELAARSLRQLCGLVEAGYPLYPSDVEYAVRILSGDHGANLKEIFLDTVLISAHKRTIAPKSLAQKHYIDSIRRHDIVFGVGPAGTGKTYLAMAVAVAALVKGDVARIVLTRPAVEAGERLGFLPGDLAEKVNPYLRPLYDALNDMVDPDRARRYMERGTIEVAPLAFMRGRTLNDSFVILDEAQNTTREQMKMFLTRLGFGSKAVITGDVTQTDLPKAKQSGLLEVRHILADIPGIDFHTFSGADVVRHPLVQRIIAAYEAYRAPGPGAGPA